MVPRYTQPAIPGLMGFIPRAKVTKVKGQKFRTSGKAANSTPTAILWLDRRIRGSKTRRARRAS